MLVRIVSVLLSYFLGRSTGHSGDAGLLANFSMRTVRRLTLLFAAVIGGLVVLLGGMTTVLIDMVLSSQGTGTVALSPVSLVGFALIGGSLLVFGVVFQVNLWRPAQIEAPQERPSPLNEALAELVRDFTRERQAARDGSAGVRDSSPRFDQSASEPPPVYM